MGANRFLDWFKAKPKTPQKRTRRKPKYLVTFDVQEIQFGDTERVTTIIKMDLDKFIDSMQEQNNKFNIIFMTKL